MSKIITFEQKNVTKSLDIMAKVKFKVATNLITETLSQNVVGEKIVSITSSNNSEGIFAFCDYKYFAVSRNNNWYLFRFEYDDGFEPSLGVQKQDIMNDLSSWMNLIMSLSTPLQTISLNTINFENLNIQDCDFILDDYYTLQENDFKVTYKDEGESYQPKSLSVLNSEFSETPENLLSEMYGNDVKLAVSDNMFRHSGTTWQPATSYMSVTTHNGDKCYQLTQSQNAAVENLYLWNYDNQSRTKRDADTGWAQPPCMKYVANSSENGVYTLSMDIKYPSGKIGSLGVVPLAASRTASSGSNAVGFTGTGDWQRISVSVNMDTTNPYMYFQVNANTALGGTPFYIKSIMFNKGTNTKYYPSYLYDTGYKHPNAGNGFVDLSIAKGYFATANCSSGTLLSSEWYGAPINMYLLSCATGGQIGTIGNIVNQAISPYCSVRYYKDSGSFDNLGFDFGYNMGINANGNVKQFNFNPVFIRSSASTPLQTKNNTSFIGYTLSSTDSSLSSWDTQWNTGDIQQRNYVFRDKQCTNINNIKQTNNSSQIVFNITHSGGSADVQGVVYVVQGRAFYTMPEKRYESVLIDITEFDTQYPLSIVNNSGVNASFIDFYDSNNVKIGSLTDNDIGDKLLQKKVFYARLWNIPEATVLPSNVLNFEEEV